MKKIAPPVLILVLFVLASIFISRQKKDINNASPNALNVTSGKTSECLQLLLQINSTLDSKNGGAVQEITELGGEPVSINNLKAKEFQEILRSNSNDLQANYGPFVMEKNNKKGGKFIQETNPELIKCSQDRVIISLWKPDFKIILDGREVTFVSSLDNNGPLQNIYVSYINKTVFSSLYVVEEINGKNTILYKINKDGFYNTLGKDIDFNHEKFYGFEFSLIKDKYFVLHILGDNGKDISDDLNIVWNDSKNVFEVLQTP